MKTLIAALALMVTPAAAQSISPLAGSALTGAAAGGAVGAGILPPVFGMPQSVPWTDTTKTTINGTATFSGNRVYLRNTKGELVGTLVVGPGGTRTMYDPDGKIIEERLP